MKEIFMKRCKKLLLLLTLFAPQRLLYCDSDPMLTAIDTSVKAVRTVYGSNPNHYNRPIYLNKIIAKYGVNWLIPSSETTGGPELTQTQIIAFIRNTLDADITSGNAAQTAADFNFFSNKAQPESTAETTLHSFIATIQSTFGKSLKLSNATGNPQFSVLGTTVLPAPTPVTPTGVTPPPPPLPPVPGGLVPPPPPMPGEQGGTVPPPPPPPSGPGGPFGPPPPPPPPLMIPSGPAEPGIAKKQKELTKLQAAYTKKITGGLDAKIKNHIGIASRAIPKKIQLCLTALSTVLDTLAIPGQDLSFINNHINENTAMLVSVPVPPSAFNKEKVRIPFTFSETDPLCTQLQVPLTEWSDAFVTSAGSDADKMTKAQELKQKIDQLIKIIVKFKKAYPPLAFIGDAGNKNLATVLNAAYPTLVAGFADLETKYTLATDAFDQAAAELARESDALLTTNPTILDDDLLAACEPIDTRLTEPGSALAESLKLFEQAITTYISPMDTAATPLIEVIQDRLATAAAPTKLLPDPDTLENFEDPDNRKGMIYTGLKEKYLKQQAAIAAGTLSTAGAPVTAPVIPDALSKLSEGFLTTLFNAPLEELAKYFEEFETTYATATPVAPTTIVGCALPILKPGFWLPAERRQTYVVGQDTTTGLFPAPSAAPSHLTDSVLAYDRSDSPFIVSSDIVPTKPLLAIDTTPQQPSGLIKTGLTCKIGILRDGYEKAPTVGRKLGAWAEWIGVSTSSDIPLANTTGGYDLYLWAPALDEALGTSPSDYAANLHRVYCASVQVNKAKKDFFEDTIRFNDICLQSGPEGIKNTRLYKLYSYKASDITKDAAGKSIAHTTYGFVNLNDASNYAEKLYNKALNMLKNKIKRTTPTAPAAR